MLKKNGGAGQRPAEMGYKSGDLYQHNIPTLRKQISLFYRRKSDRFMVQHRRLPFRAMSLT
jgi:hypothetical protein